MCAYKVVLDFLFISSFEKFNLFFTSLKRGDGFLLFSGIENSFKEYNTLSFISWAALFVKVKASIRLK